MISELLGLPARYTVSRLLGRGAEKRVYLAEDTMLDRPVAIAAVEAWPGGEPAAYLLQEARAMARIGDLPHLVPVYDVIESPAAFYVVSRYLFGGDLATRLRAGDKRAFSLRQSVRLATQ